MKYLFLTVVCSLVWVTQVHAADNLLSNGDFELGGTDWQKFSDPAATAIGIEADNHFLALINSTITLNVSVEQKVKVEAGQWLEFTGKIRVKNLTSDHKANWHNARIQTTWKNIDGKNLTVWPPSPNHDYSTGGWVEFHEFMKVPDAAVSLLVAPALFYSSGEVDFDDLVLKVVSEDAVPDDIKNRAR